LARLRVETNDGLSAKHWDFLLDLLLPAVAKRRPAERRLLFAGLREELRLGLGEVSGGCRFGARCDGSGNSCREESSLSNIGCPPNDR
jgi:hypothetical protein